MNYIVDRLCRTTRKHTMRNSSSAHRDHLSLLIVDEMDTSKNQHFYREHGQ